MRSDPGNPSVGPGFTPAGAHAQPGAPVLVEVKVQSLGLDRASNTPVVILEEMDGERVLPIWIGPGEASAIAMRLADMKFSRPLTHDLIMSVLGHMGGTLERVVISRVTDATYYAELVIQLNGETITVDARPSDSIAVALRSEARIFASDALLERATIEIDDGDQPAAPHPGAGATPPGPEGWEGEADPGSEEDAEERDPRPLEAEELKEYLRNMNPEDFGRFTP